jgi:hypothetical protein
MWGRSLSDERTGLSFTISAGARQRHVFLSQIRDFHFCRLLRLARAMVGVLDPASTREKTAARLMSSLYNTGADPTESTAPTILLLLSWAVAYRQTAYRFHGNMFTNRYQATHIPSSDHCIGSVLHSKICLLQDFTLN